MRTIAVVNILLHMKYRADCRKMSAGTEESGLLGPADVDSLTLGHAKIDDEIEPLSRKHSRGERYGVSHHGGIRSIAVLAPRNSHLGA